jgi:hypothetical protein
LQSEPSQALNETVTPFAEGEKPQLFPSPAARLIKNSQIGRDLEGLLLLMAISMGSARRSHEPFSNCFY